MLYKTVSYFIDENTAAKVNIVSSPGCDMLSKMVSPMQLEKRYGGEADNKNDGFWPPRLNS